MGRHDLLASLIVGSLFASCATLIVGGNADATAGLLSRLQLPTIIKDASYPPVVLTHLTYRRSGKPDTVATITDDTEILLDDKPCRWEDVPKDATLDSMQIDIDRKTVWRLRFVSKKESP